MKRNQSVSYTHLDVYKRQVQYIVNKVSTGVKNQSNLSLPLYFTRTYMYKKYPKGNTPKIVPISLGFAKPPNGVNTVGT